MQEMYSMETSSTNSICACGCVFRRLHNPESVGVHEQPRLKKCTTQAVAPVYMCGAMCFPPL